MRTLHVGLRVADLQRSLAFYTGLGYAVIGQVPETEFGSLTMLKLPGDAFATVELVHDPRRGDVDPGGLNHLVIQVDSMSATVAELTARDLQVDGPGSPDGSEDFLTAWHHRPRRLPHRTGAVARGSSRRHDRGGLRWSGMSGSRVALDDALDPLVVALDVGSTASRGDVYDAAGRPVEGGRRKVAHSFRTAGDGTSEIDPDQVTDELGQILTELVDRPLEGRIGGVALDTFASSLVGVDADGPAVSPCYTYADSRCGRPGHGAARRARRGPGAAAHRLPPAQQLPPGPVAVAARDRPRPVRRRPGDGCRWASTPTCGCWGRRPRAPPPPRGPACSTAAPAAGTPRCSAPPGSRPTSCPRSATRTARSPTSIPRWPGGGRPSPGPPGSRPSPTASPATSAPVPPTRRPPRWPRPPAAPSGCSVHDIPEKIPPGLWCYRVDSRRSLLGGALSDVGRMVSWLQDTVRLGEEEPDRLLAAAPDPGTPLVLPYLSGERATGWAADARAVIAGVSTATDGAALFRGAMEGVALAYARIADQLRTAVGDPRRIVASGRVTQDLPGWLQVLADVLDAPVDPVTSKRTTLHGTALHALEVLAPDTARAPLATAPTLQPVAAHADHYRQRAEEYDRLYRAVIGAGPGPTLIHSPHGAAPAGARSADRPGPADPRRPGRAAARRPGAAAAPADRVDARRSRRRSGRRARARLTAERAPASPFSGGRPGVTFAACRTARISSSSGRVLPGR